MGLLPKQSSNNYKPSKDHFFNNLYDRFLNTAQEILCNRNAASLVAEKAIKRFKDKYHNRKGKSPQGKLMPQWAIEVLDSEINNYFLEILDQVRKQDKRAENIFLTIIERRYQKNMVSKIASDIIHWDKCDVEDIVQEARSITFNKCLEVRFEGLFIQWAQTILNNKYRERRRQKVRQIIREKHIDDETFEKKYSKRLSDMVSKKRTPEVDPDEAEEMIGTLPKQSPADPFEGDAHYFKPDIIVEGNDLKEQLLNLVKRIKRKACQKVFAVLFSDGDRKFMYKQFPNRTNQQIDLLVSQCRKQLRLEALKAGII